MSTIYPAAIDHVRNGVCAVGYSTVSPKRLAAEFASPYFKVLGTGFLVRDATVITNRHVLQAIQFHQADKGLPDDQIVAQFVYPTQSGWQTANCHIEYQAWLGEVDIGFLDIRRATSPEFEQCKPLAFDDLARLTVGNPIALFGYPYGTEMLTKDLKMFRFGPVMQQGFISAIAPFHSVDPTEINEILLDVRTAGGMSGAPVFWPHTGKVFGIHYGGWEATTQLALPLTKEKVDGWLEAFEREKELRT